MSVLSRERLGVGRSPALVVVDAMVGFTDPTLPLGTQSQDEVDAIAVLLALFRERGWPVAFTSNAYEQPHEASVFREKLPVLNTLAAGSEVVGIVPSLAPRAGELLFRKIVPSAFFDSPLRAWLNERNIDSTVVCGFSTSGCVRATAVDALQCNFRVIVVPEACGDRDLEAHVANLRDIELKYGDVMSLTEATAELKNL